MDWKKLLESLLPGLLQFLEGVMKDDGDTKVAAAAYISQHALAIACVPLPSHDHMTLFIQNTIQAMKAKGKSGLPPNGQSGVYRPNVGEIIQPS